MTLDDLLRLEQQATDNDAQITGVTIKSEDADTRTAFGDTWTFYKASRNVLRELVEVAKAAGPVAANPYPGAPFQGESYSALLVLRAALARLAARLEEMG